jgi:mycofactocin glycosyltransferase
MRTGSRNPVSPAARRPPAVSLVIPVYNDRDNLRRCLQALGPAASRGCEVLVVDDASDSPVGELAREFSCRFLRVPKNRGPAHARNAGLARARGRIVLFTDSDCEPMPGWVPALAGELVRSRRRSRDVAAVYGSLRSPDSFLKRCDDYTGYAYVLGGKRGAMTYLNTACAAAYAGPLREIGGFDESLRSGEDVDLSRRLQARGHRVIYEPSIFVLHHHRGVEGLRAFFRKHYAWGRRIGLTLDRRRSRLPRPLAGLLWNAPVQGLLVLPLAALTTLKIVALQLRQGRWDVLACAIVILAAKIGFRWGIFLSGLAAAGGRKADG